LEERAEAAEARAARAEAGEDELLAELERVVRRHQETREGFDFRSPVLNAALRRRAEKEEQGVRAVPPFEAWRAARSRSGGDEGEEGD
jgi:hypothetical protein